MLYVVIISHIKYINCYSELKLMFHLWR